MIMYAVQLDKEQTKKSVVALVGNWYRLHRFVITLYGTIFSNET